ncbi:MAG: hypothetical protein V3T56_08015 [Gemmatimonadales bacterium]
MKRLVASMGVGAVVALALPTAATAQMTDRPEGKEMTISGTVIDLSCRFAFNVTGAEHRMCAQVCADAGVPLAILGDDGTLYLPVSSGMPGSSQNTQLKPHAEHKVTVKGMVFEAGGAMAIQIASISM